MRRPKLNKRLSIILVIVIIIVSAVVVYYSFIKENGIEYALEKVAAADVVKEVSETGVVKASEEAELSFKNGGRIEKIYVKAGDEVKLGQELADLDKADFYIQLKEANAALDVAQANYDKLLAGASQEEIKVSETKVLSAEIDLDNAKQDLTDAESEAEEDLNNAYEDALDVLDDGYLKIYNGYNAAVSVYRSYFTNNDQEGTKVKDNKDKIENAFNNAKKYLNTAKNGSREDIDNSLSKMKDALSDVRDGLGVIRDMSETTNYRNTVSSADKTSLDNQKSYINTSYSAVVGAKQTISTTKIDNELSINSAKASLASAEASLQKAKDDLALLKAGPRREDINLYQAKLDQARANIYLLENKIREATLRSPADGQITRVDKTNGETVQAAESIISFLPIAPFKIEVDIYEEDIVNVEPSNPVEITLVSFPDEHLKGSVVSVDPAEKLIDGVVYYQVDIDFLEVKKGIKIGMTADIIIEVARKENVLAVSKGAVDKIDGKMLVEVFEGGEIKQREIKTGLEGVDYFEVLSGLKEGEEVVIR